RLLSSLRPAADLSRVVGPQVLQVRGILRILLSFGIGITGHAVERKGLDRVREGGVGVHVLAIAVRVEKEIPLPSLGEMRKTIRLELQSNLPPAPETPKAV